MKRIQVLECGGPDAMQLADVPVPEPGPGQALVKLGASGVNFIDVYFRMGLYKGDMPLTLGSEGAGIVARVGHGGQAGRSRGLRHDARVLRGVRARGRRAARAGA